jgi:hypothetical protein
MRSDSKPSPIEWILDQITLPKKFIPLMKTILAPIDFSDAMLPDLEAATLLAEAFQAMIVLTYVIRPAMIANA